MSLHYCSNDHTAVPPSVCDTRQHRFRSSASFPAQIGFCRRRWQWHRRALCGSPLGCPGPELRSPVLGEASLSSAVGPALSCICLCACLLTSYFPSIFPCQIKNRFIYEYVSVQGGTLTLKWTCKEPVEKQVPAALIMRTDKAALLGLFMTFCLCELLREIPS